MYKYYCVLILLLYTDIIMYCYALILMLYIDIKYKDYVLILCIDIMHLWILLTSLYH